MADKYLNDAGLTSLWGKVKGRVVHVGTMDTTTSTSTAFVVSAPNVTSLYDGLTIIIKNTKVTSASGCTLKINSLDAKAIYLPNNMGLTSGWTKNYTFLFVYDATLAHWIAYGYDANTTYNIVSTVYSYTSTNQVQFVPSALNTAKFCMVGFLKPFTAPNYDIDWFTTYQSGMNNILYLINTTVENNELKIRRIGPVDTSVSATTTFTVSEIAVGGGGSSVSWNQIVQSGTKIGEITIDSVTTDIYSDAVSWTQVTQSGTKIGEITINGTTTNIYAPVSGGAPYTEVTGTLVAGNTSITLSDNSITASSTLDIYTDTYGVSPTSVTSTAGSVTLVFEAQQSDVSVRVRIW